MSYANLTYLRQFLFLLFLLLVKNVDAVDYRYSIFSTLSYSDNIAQSLDASSGYSLDTGVSFGVNTDENSPLTFDLTGTFSREIFSLDELSSQDTKLLTASLDYEATSTNFSLLIRDDLSQTPQNRFSTQQVGNIADVNIITVRPSYFFRLTSIDRIYAELTYIESNRKELSDVQSDNLGFDTVNKGKSVRYERQINSTTNISLVADSTDIEFEGLSTTETIDFTQDDLFIRWVGIGRYNLLQLELGRSEVTDQFEREFDTDLANAIYTRQINRTHELEIAIRNGFFVILNENFTDGTVSINNQSSNFGTAQKFNSGAINYVISDSILNSSINLFYLNFDSTNDESNEKRVGIDVTVTYSLTRLLETSQETNITFGYRRTKNKFDLVIEDSIESDIENKIENFGIRVNYESTLSLSYFIELARRNTSSTGRFSRLGGGDSNSISIGFIYEPFEREEN